MSTNKKVYLEVIRIIAIILVIFNHTDGTIYYLHTENALTWIYSMILTLICRAGVPLFFMVTGALLLKKEESITKLFKRIWRIIVVLFIISLSYYLFDIARGRIDEAGVADFCERFSSNGIRESFWFLYTYVFVLLTFPFFRKMAPFLDRKLIAFLVAIRGITQLIVPLFNNMFGISIPFEAGFASGYIYYALLGYYLDNRYLQEKQVEFKKILVCFTTLICANAIIMYLMFNLKGEYKAAGIDYMVFLTAPCIWVMVRKLFDKTPENGKCHSAFCVIGGCTFGIYLLDNYVRWQLLPIYLWLSEKTIGVLACSIYVILTFAVGLIYTILLKKIPLLKRYL